MLHKNNSNEEFIKNEKGNIVSINGIKLNVENLTNKCDKPFFKVEINGKQGQGLTHNEAVLNALKRTKRINMKVYKN